MGYPFRWLPYDGHRHAIPSELAEGHDGYTLCGESLTVPPNAWANPVRACWPTCPACDEAWRKAEGIQPRHSADLDPNGGVNSVPSPRMSGVVSRRPAPKRVAS